MPRVKTIQQGKRTQATVTSLYNPTPVGVGAKLTRTRTISLNQTGPNCIQKAHSRLLSNYFSYLLKTNVVSRINKLTVDIDGVLDTYSVEEDDGAGGKTVVPGYGGGLGDVIGHMFDDINNLRPTKYGQLFTRDELIYLKDLYNTTLNNELPVIDAESNIDNNNAVNPGDTMFTRSIQNFINESLRYSENPALFKNYFSIDVLFIPSMYYWFGSLDGVSNSRYEGLHPNSELTAMIGREMSTVSWDGEKYITNKNHPDSVRPLTDYLTVRRIPIEPSYFTYPGHALVIKGYDKDYRGLGPCYLIQNSWGPSWNRKIAKCDSAGTGRWISAEIINKLIYGIIRIEFPNTNVFAYGITKRKGKRKTKNKRKQTRRLKK
jgi:hypothetical protein